MYRVVTYLLAKMTNMTHWACRERSDGLYRVITYLLAKMVEELIIATLSSFVLCEWETERVHEPSGAARAVAGVGATAPGVQLAPGRQLLHTAIQGRGVPFPQPLPMRAAPSATLLFGKHHPHSSDVAASWPPPRAACAALQARPCGGRSA